jgi:alpha-1,2-mannosyltransferase
VRSFSLSQFSKWHVQSVAIAANWLKPKRLRVYPAAVAICTVIAQALEFWIILARGSSPLILVVGGDFIAYYTAGRFLLDGRAHELYNQVAVSAFQHALPGLQTIPGYNAILNLPFAALLYAPFAIFGYLPGLLLWTAAGLAAWAFTIYLFRKLVLPAEAPSVQRLMLMSLTFYPVLACFFFGQNVAFTLLLFTSFFILLRQGRDLSAGVLLGCLLYKPQLAVGLVVVLVVQRRWRAVLGGALSVACLLLISVAVSPTAMRDYVPQASGMLELQRMAGWGENSLAFLAYLMLDGVWKPAGSVLGAALTVSGFILLVRWWWGRSWQPGTRTWDLLMAATFVLGWLASPHLYVYDLMLFLLPLGIVWAWYPHGTAGRALDGGVLLAWTAALYVAVWMGNYLTSAQLMLTAALGLPSIALQLGIPILLIWAMQVRRQAVASATVHAVSGPELPSTVATPSPSYAANAN